MFLGQFIEFVQFRGNRNYGGFQGIRIRPFLHKIWA